MRPIPGVIQGLELTITKPRKRGKIETKVQKDRKGSNRQPNAGNESTQKIGGAPRIPKPGAGPDKQAGLGAKPLSTCFSGSKSQDSIFPSFNSLSIKCRKYYL